ncbi:hypothetical protein [Furfurilactobacillus milii]
MIVRGFTKKTQKTPHHEISQAKKKRFQYLKEKANHETNID